MKDTLDRNVANENLYRYRLFHSFLIDNSENNSVFLLALYKLVSFECST